MSLIGPKISDGDRLLDKIITGLFLLGMILTVLGFFYTRKTIIELKILLIIFFSPGVILTPIFYNLLNKIDGRKGHWVLHYLLHTIIVGGLILYLFMATNFYKASDYFSQQTYDVIGVGGFKRNQTEHVIIKYENQERKIYVPKVDPNIVRNARKVSITMREGFWNYKVITKSEIIE